MKMFALLQKVLDQDEGGPDRNDLLRSVLLLLKRYVDDCHHGKEERVLFPELERQGAEDAQGLTADLRKEHESAAHLMSAMLDDLARREAGGTASIRDRAGRYLDLMRAHIRRENADLLPLCGERFQAETDRFVLERMEEVETDLLEPGEKERILAELSRLSSG
jgi:hemerythrin-like domain-containing protein